MHTIRAINPTLDALLGQASQYWYEPAQGRWLWTMIVLPLVALLCAGLIYWNERGNSQKRRRIVPLLIRVFLISMLVFAILDWRRHGVATRKPDLIVVLDDSLSSSHVDNYDDDSWSQDQLERLRALNLPEELSRFQLAQAALLGENGRLLKKLAESYQLQVVRAGESLRYVAGDSSRLREALKNCKPEQGASRLGDTLAQLCRAQRGTSTAAIVLLSDGVLTDGISLEDAAQIAADSNIPVFTVGLGIDQSSVDLRLSQLKADDMAFVGDWITLELMVAADGLLGQTAEVQFFDSSQNQPLQTIELAIDSDDFSAPVKFRHRVTDPGVSQFKIQVAPVEGETNLENNTITKRIDVRDDSIRVLLVQGEPTPEYRFLKQLFDRQRKSASGSDKSIELTTVLQSAEYQFQKTDDTSKGIFPVNRAALAEYDVVIFCDVQPQWSGGKGLGEFELENLNWYVQENGGSVVFVAGPRHMPASYVDSPLSPLFPFESVAADPPGEPIRFLPTRLGKELPLFRVPGLKENPPDAFSVPTTFRWHWPIESCKRGVLILAEAISVESPNSERDPTPLLTLQYLGSGRVVFQATDETYRWRFRRGDALFGHYWVQLIRMLARKRADRQKEMKIATDRLDYRQGENVSVTATFFDTRLFQGKDSISVQLASRNSGQTQERVLTADPGLANTFRGELLELPADDYEIRYRLPGSQKTVSTSFQVRPANREMENLQRNTSGLKQLSTATGGKYLSIQDVETIAGRLPKGAIEAVRKLPTQQLWTWWPFVVGFAAIFVTLISLEWILRKKLGMI